MRVFICIAMATLAVNSAQAQLRLPIAPLPPLPVQKLTQTVAQAGAGTLEQLSDARHLLTANLIRTNPRTVAADPHGNPIVRGELLAYSPATPALEEAQANGFRIARQLSAGDLDIHLVVLQPPLSMSIVKALRQLREADPAGTYDFNHIYTGVGVVSAGVSNGAQSPQSGAAGRPDQPVPRVGLIDSGVDGSHPVFRDAL